MSEDSSFIIVLILLFSLLPILLPFLSWAFGRWYQGRLMDALVLNEKQHGMMLQNDQHLSTASSMTTMTAESSTLLHVSICVGPSMGQIFFMWFKSIFGGRLHSYDVVLDYGRREALLRLNQQAKELGCSSMVNIRIETSTVSFTKNNNNSKTSSVEFLAFATGIRQ
ncbi:MAG: hypothetical protein DWC03_06975 [Candidatus Poseidoniales archaeon]|nr:MAG: hypothetical protein DWC03_06975 [Candidatus Poseidoniales archaeon]